MIMIVSATNLEDYEITTYVCLYIQLSLTTQCLLLYLQLQSKLQNRQQPTCNANNIGVTWWVQRGFR